MIAKRNLAYLVLAISTAAVSTAQADPTTPPSQLPMSHIPATRRTHQGNTADVVRKGDAAYAYVRAFIRSLDAASDGLRLQYTTSDAAPISFAPMMADLKVANASYENARDAINGYRTSHIEDIRLSAQAAYALYSNVIATNARLLGIVRRNLNGQRFDLASFTDLLSDETVMWHRLLETPTAFVIFAMVDHETHHSDPAIHLALTCTQRDSILDDLKTTFGRAVEHMPAEGERVSLTATPTTAAALLNTFLTRPKECRED